MLATLFASLLATLPIHADGTLLHRFESLPADAEVHVVSTSEPRFCGIEEDEITDWRELIKQLRADSGPGAYIRKRLRKDADEVLNEDAEKGMIDGVDPTAVPRRVRMALSKALGRAMWFKSFHDETAFAGVDLPKSVKELIALGDRRTIYQNELLNRELLAAAFPTCIGPPVGRFSPRPRHSQSGQTSRADAGVRVPVPLGGNGRKGCRSRRSRTARRRGAGVNRHRRHGRVRRRIRTER